jgi:hypothetical protein
MRGASGHTIGLNTFFFVSLSISWRLMIDKKTKAGLIYTRTTQGSKKRKDFGPLFFAFLPHDKKAAISRRNPTHSHPL